MRVYSADIGAYYKYPKKTTANRSSAIAQRARKRDKRDKPACYICGQAIDYTLPYSDPMCFVADHVTPLDKGGIDALSNLRATHRECNSKKRARLIAPIVRRSGSLD